MHRAFRLPVLVLIMGIGTAGSISGCLAFKDFDLLEENGGAAENRPCSAEYECADFKLYFCMDGERREVVDCDLTEQFCNAELATCVDCLPGQPLQCDENENTLMSCGPSGTLVPEANCGAMGLYCTDAKESCVPCITGRTYCTADEDGAADGAFFTCRDFAIPESSLSCPYGCEKTADGQQGKCATCPEAGELYCHPDGTGLYRCPQDRTLDPVLEVECPDEGCDPQLAAPECL